MININKKIALPAIALAIVGTALFGAQYASAQDFSNADNTLVQKIADKFGLNKDEVQKVFDEEHELRHAEMQKKAEDRLNTLVSEGKITDAQKTLIINKQKELQEKRQANKDSFKDKTSEEIKSQKEAQRTELEAWAKENGINTEYLFRGNFITKIGGHNSPKQ